MRNPQWGCLGFCKNKENVIIPLTSRGGGCNSWMAPKAKEEQLKGFFTLWSFFFLKCRVHTEYLASKWKIKTV